MRWLIALTAAVTLGCGVPRQPASPDAFGNGEVTDSGVVHPETNGQSCGQCHGSVRTGSGS